MKKFNMKELEISFNMVKQNGQDFTEEEIDKFNDEFIKIVEKNNYLVGGSIGPYIENDDFEDLEDLEDFDYDIEDDDIIDDEDF